ncbi:MULTISPECIES: PadR family transcriptional regulator [unclassified Streptomyces]|uniref:PadR family transcriptional regulator n=1 Tax=Streptomyces TaxID=1883 RepID=UPI0005631CEC|nr:PadR family transcriptional regulator [Streptomyces sp. NHF165]
MVRGVTERKKPLQEPTLLILTALADAPRHGYALSQEITQMSEGRVKLRTGTLYGALERLQADGLIAVFAEERVEGRLRRTYTLTAQGRQTLTEEARRLAATAREATRRLNNAPDSGTAEALA